MRATTHVGAQVRDSRSARAIERRARSRGTGESEPNRSQLVFMIAGTYRVMPGLALQLSQAARLFGLRAGTCQIVLDDLVRAGQLRRARDGQYTAL